MPIDKQSTLHWRDAEALEWFAAKGIDLIQRSPLGAQLERLHDEVGITNGLPSTNPSWILDYSAHTDSARSRRIGMRLTRAARLYRPAASVLMALHDPVAVGCDGVCIEDADGKRTAQGRLDVGRILAVYPCTPTADEARRWRGCFRERSAAGTLGRILGAMAGSKKPAPAGGLDRISHVMTRAARDGSAHSPSDALRLLAATKRGAKGDEKGLWNRIDREAREMIQLSTDAWNAAETEAEAEAEVFSTGESLASLVRAANDALPAVEAMRGLGR